MPPKTKKTKKYVKMDQIDHILHRSDMYTGSTRPKYIEEYVCTGESFQIVKKSIKYSPAILRIFIEVLSNAIDNVSRSKESGNPCTKIKVNIDRKTGETSIWNDGEVIPINKDNDEECYNHSLIFGQLLTSSNYDDEEDRYNISGRNGVGAKATCVFSSYFRVRGVDPEEEKSFEQIWRNNMKDVAIPKVKASKLKKGFTEVTWIPDFKQFKIKEYSQDIVDLYCKYVVDTAMIAKVNVYFNDMKIPVKTLEDYSKLYTGDSQDILYFKTKNSEIVVTPSEQFQSISFANGVYTSLGGTHVDAWVEGLFRPVVKKLTKPKSTTYNIGDVKKFFRIFVVITLDKPEYESQSKLMLESPVTISVPKKYINELLRWDVIDDIQRSKEMVVLKKLERKKKGFIKVDNLDPANNAGGKFSTDCTLMIVEGLSAKTYAVQGIEVGAFGRMGRDWHGVYALRGKALNVRNAKATAISKNNVVADIIKTLGVKHDVDYTKDEHYNNLQYGRVMIITDADVDGIHISGLVQNLFHTLFPSLLERNKSFLTAMQTPIVRVFIGKKHLLFYDEREYQKYVKRQSKINPTKKINKKYYKGLGSSSANDIRETFGKKLVEFKNDEQTTYNMNKVFHKNHSDARKEWLEKYDPKNIALRWDGDTEEVVSLNISDFLNTELIKFSLDDCKRSIPHFMDGLKESQRKVLHACFLRKLKYTGKTLKVAQLSGYVAEKTSYHHGEQNLYDTITRMANEYVGSNNIPLLYRDGQFGTKLVGGKDAANARYIFTKLDYLTRLIYREEDDVLLERVVDDGDVVEPKFFVPIIPMILVNGITAGIGTGFSCNVPCYNPLDIIQSIKVWLECEEEAVIIDETGVVSELPEIHPWYRGFTGEIKQSGTHRYATYGNISIERKNKVVNELPIGLWTDNFKEFLDKLMEDKCLKKVKNYSTPKKVKFVITESDDGIECSLTNLKLCKYVYTSNMVMFTEEEKLKKFFNVDEIIDCFCKVRLDYYGKRKKYILDKLNHDIKFLGNKKRFLEEVMNGDIKLFDDSGKKRKSRKTVDIITDLEKHGYDKWTDNEEDEQKDTNEEDEQKDTNDKGYDYLLRLQFRSITEEKINKLKNDIASNIEKRDELQSTTEKQLWLNDLDEFEQEYTKFLVIMEKESGGKKRAPKKKAPPKKK